MDAGFLHGNDLRLQGSIDCRRYAAQVFPHAYDGGGNHYTGAGVCDWRGRRRTAGYLHRAQAGRRGPGLRLRPAAKEQVQSLGGRFVELPLEAKDAQDARGYGTQQDESFYQRQRELLGRVVAESDVVITAAPWIPGKNRPPWRPRNGQRDGAGSATLDLAAERGGNCEIRPAPAKPSWPTA